MICCVLTWHFIQISTQRRMLKIRQLYMCIIRDPLKRFLLQKYLFYLLNSCVLKVKRLS